MRVEIVLRIVQKTNASMIVIHIYFKFRLVEITIYVPLHILQLSSYSEKTTSQHRSPADCAPLQPV